jgi:hypothetical protein
MREIIGYIRKYSVEVHKLSLVVCTLFVAILVWLNYFSRLEARVIAGIDLPLPPIMGRYLIFLTAFIIPYLLVILFRKRYDLFKSKFLICLLLSPLIFAIKAGMSSGIRISPDHDWNSYWNAVIYWPLRLVILVFAVYVTGLFLNAHQISYGLTVKRINWTPYILMLLIMIPLIAAASTQPDFLSTYPKMKEVLPLPVDASPSWWYKLLFELSYGSDFFSIEFFFRGFLVIGFMRWVGMDAILPMACFYCTIHFGKPLGECISSYFGGLLLGIVSYHTRSIYGGLMVHLGIAWLMEAGGHIGNLH